MSYFVYIIISYSNKKYISYVGYAADINKRINAHNSSKGAKFTRGRKWKLIFKKKFDTKSDAMKAEIKIKKDIKFRSLIKQKYINNVTKQSSN